MFANPELQRTVWSIWEEIFATLSVDLGEIRAWKWSSKRMIIFQSVILQHVRSVTGAKNICAQIKFQIDFWNRGTFDKLANDMYTAAMGHLGKARGTQRKEQRHRKFSNLVLKRKFCKEDRFICAMLKGGVLPRKLALDKKGVINETSAYILAGEIRTEKFPPILRWIHTTKCLFLFV